MSLEVSNLACRRGGQILFAGINLALVPGNIAHVSGPNGSGKSSLLLAIAGILAPEHGRVLWNGQPINAEVVAYAGHLDGLKPALSLRENLHAWAGILGTNSARIENALTCLGIAHCSDLPAGGCSAGQRRRAALARVLIADRPLWLLDEPTATLDPSGHSILGSVLQQHRDAGGIAIVATHDALLPEPTQVVDIAETRSTDVVLDEWGQVLP